MFGFSVAKLLVILLAIVGVIVAVRLFRSVQRGGGRVTRTSRRPLPKEGDLSECVVCGDFVDAGAGACGRSDCPR